MDNRLITIIIVAAALVAVILRARSGGLEYTCGKCGQTFTLDPGRFIIAPHIMGNRLVRCPHCGKLTWATPA